MHQRGFPTNQKSGRPHVTLSFTEAPLMRLSVGSLRQVVKRDLPIEFVPQQLTSYGGLELLHRYVRRLGLYPRLRRACADLGGDYGGARLSLLPCGPVWAGPCPWNSAWTPRFSSATCCGCSLPAAAPTPSRSATGAGCPSNNSRPSGGSGTRWRRT